MIEDFLRQVSAAPRRRDLWDLMLGYMHDHGAVMASYHTTDTAGKLHIATDGFPEEWVCRYIEHDLVKIDPIPNLAKTLSRPFFWHEVRELAPISTSSDKYLHEMDDAHLGDGLAFYVFGPNMQNAYVGLGFGKDYITLSTEKVFEFQCVAQAGHLRFCELNSDAATPVSLTRRETDVLEWMARGKSNSVIADILKMSPHTVDSHVRKIFAKLDVADRTTAALRGLGSGLIHVA